MRTRAMARAQSQPVLNTLVTKTAAKSKRKSVGKKTVAKPKKRARSSSLSNSAHRVGHRHRKPVQTFTPTRTLRIELRTARRAHITADIRHQTHEKLRLMAEGIAERLREQEAAEIAENRRRGTFKATGIPPYLKRIRREAEVRKRRELADIYEQEDRS